MFKYFKGLASADLGFGPGTFYMEFADEWVTRQVEAYADRWFHSDNTNDYFEELGSGLCDQPLSTLAQANILTEISKAEFEDAWIKAIQRH